MYRENSQNVQPERSHRSGADDELTFKIATQWKFFLARIPTGSSNLFVWLLNVLVSN